MYGQQFNVSTWAGLAGAAGSGGATRSAARFSAPAGVAVDGAGSIYVADTGNSTIRKITPAGAVSTLAGSAGLTGSANGAGAAARFKYPGGVAADAAGNVYVADTGNSIIRQITAAGMVSTLAGSPGNPGSADGTGSAARFSSPQGVAVDGAGNVYVADTGNSTIRKITSTGRVTTLAGSPGNTGNADGAGSAAQFNSPAGVAVDSAGRVYVTDAGSECVRRVSSNGQVTTLAGALSTLRWCDHGYAGENVYRDSCLRALQARGATSTFHPLQNTSGGWNLWADGNVVLGMYILGTPSPVDGHRTDDWVDRCSRVGVTTQIPMLFNSPDVFAADFSEHDAYLRWVANSINWAPAAQFIVCIGLDVDRNQQISTAWTPAYVNQMAGKLKQYTSNRFKLAIHARYPQCLTWGTGASIDIIYVETVQPWDADVMASTLADVKARTGKTAVALTTGTSVDGVGTAARFKSPAGIAVDDAGSLYVSDTDSHTLRKIAPGTMTTTLAGLAGNPGAANGAGSTARFNQPAGTAVDKAGNVFVADCLNHTIRKGSLQNTLVVVSAYGTANPAAGAYWYNWGSSLTATIGSPVANGTSQYVCVGWTGTGSVPAAGTTTNTGPFTLTSDSVLTWRWTTNYTPAIRVTPSIRDFGSLLVGAAATLNFTVQNMGGGLLTGVASVPAPFSVVTDANYSLASGQSRTVTVRYSAGPAGNYDRTVGFTGGGGATSTVLGSAYDAGAAIAVTPSNLWFGLIDMGSMTDLSFTVRNAGVGTLAGRARVPDPFAVVLEESYSLGPGQDQTVTVRYYPTSVGSHSNNVVFTGGGGVTRPVSGSARAIGLPWIDVLLGN